MAKRPLTRAENDAAKAFKTAVTASTKTQQGIAEEIEVTQGMVWQWMNGRSPIPARRAVRAAQAVGAEPCQISVEYRQSIGEASSTMAVALPETQPGYLRFPLLEGFAGMGRGDYVGDYPEVVQFVEVTREWASQQLRGVPFEAIRVITGRGPSMRGMFDDGDPIFLDARVKQFLGDAVYCFRWNGLVYIKKLQMVGKNQARILSANPDYEPYDVPLDELEIGGRALRAWTLKSL